MHAYWRYFVFTSILLILYSVIFYFQFNLQLKMDTTSFYAAAVAFSNNENPFYNISSTFLANNNSLPANLNPPAFVQLISPIVHFSFKTVVSLWFIISFILGIAGALICFYLITTKTYFKKYFPIFILFYLAMTSTLINIQIGQLGGVLLFFTMAGYYFFLKNRDYYAGFCWGFIIAIKLFPGLLVFFALVQKRYKVFFASCLFCFLFCLIPLWSKGISIYTLYLKLLSLVFWYDSNWNASLYGYLFRLLITTENIFYVRYFCNAIFLLSLLWYMKEMIVLKQYSTHISFCFTLLMMLMLNPMGWVYYFSLLLMPLTYICYLLNTGPATTQQNTLWVISLFLINIPMYIVQGKDLNPFLYRASIYSIYFYGLFTVTYLFLALVKNKEQKNRSELISKPKDLAELLPVKTALSLGLLMMLLMLVVAKH